MDKHQNHMTKKILEFTLDIIYLLIGEDYEVVKKTSNENWTSFPPPLLTPAGIKKQKILEVTQKMIELLTGEVPIRCQDVTVYFSMEEWEYLEGHKDLYKDVMMEDHQTLTSPDGSSNGNPPERCPRPLYSRDSTQEGQEIPHHHQGKEPNIMKDDANNRSVEGDHQSTEKYRMMVAVKEEKCSLDKDGSSNRNPPESCPRPLYSRDSTHDDHTASRLHQSEDDVGSVTGDHQSTEKYRMMVAVKEEQSSLHIDGAELTTPERLDQVSSLVYNREFSPEDTRDTPTMHNRASCVQRSMDPPKHEDNSQIHPRLPTKDKSLDPCIPCRLSSAHSDSHVDKVSESFRSELFPVEEQKTNMSERSFSCMDCGNYFKHREDYVNHQRIHTAALPISEFRDCFTHNANLTNQECHGDENTFSCVQCRKSFSKKRALLAHQRSHLNKRTFLCSLCGKSFVKGTAFLRHQKRHKRERPFSSSDGGKCFIQKRKRRREKIHTGERPFSCSECGKSFVRKSVLNDHKRIHTGERPFSCLVCGKSFARKSVLIDHKRIHTGERPFSCLECGKSFARKYVLMEHQKVHVGQRPFSCEACGKSFARKSVLTEHQKVHLGQRPFSCEECGKSFVRKSVLNEHRRMHMGKHPF
ncbi:uncharacterized protein [Pyxicephalus adspersus]|uniref:uncharacterized protein isoform X7 n=1 Tax=Pyxicephalus adspersus TaxID=30357 RepID=UPI003B5AD5E1